MTKKKCRFVHNLTTCLCFYNMTHLQNVRFLHSRIFPCRLNEDILKIWQMLVNNTSTFCFLRIYVEFLFKNHSMNGYVKTTSTCLFFFFFCIYTHSNYTVNSRNDIFYTKMYTGTVFTHIYVTVVYILNLTAIFAFILCISTETTLLVSEHSSGTHCSTQVSCICTWVIVSLWPTFLIS